jgi:hypothetical protein
MSRTFMVQLESKVSREELKRQILTKLSVPLGKAGYTIESQSGSAVSYAHTYRPYAVLAVAFCWLVIPLLLFLIERTERIVFTISGSDGAAHLVVVGDGPRGVRRWFEELQSLD